MTSHKNLKFLLIWDPSEDISISVTKDKEILSDYCKKITKNGYDVDYEEISTKDVEDYNTIIKKCENKTRIIIWYTGHGYNVSVTTSPYFIGNNGIHIDQYNLSKELPKNASLNVTIFDCCSKNKIYNINNITMNVNNNFSTLFDFKGIIFISTINHNYSHFRRTTEGSTFTIDFLNKFYNTYQNTLSILRLIYGPITYYDDSNYDKYIKDCEEILK